MDPLRLQSSLGLLLRPLAVLYSLLTGLRRKGWETGFMNRLNPSCPCVSVGNIAWGGTGKTPVTGWLMDWAAAHNVKAVVLSRGYKADLGVVPVYVKPQHSAREVGDEPLMLAMDHPEGVVLVDPNRRRSGKYALGTLSPGLLLLDDGFQHLPVRRDLDLVLLRPEDLSTEWNRVIPAGSWRENASALTRASAFLFKGDAEEMQRLLPAIKMRLRRFERPVFSFTLRPTALEAVTPRVHGTAEDLHEAPYALLAGVGNPQQVRDTVTRFLGHAPMVEVFFPDHYAYTFRDADRIAKSGLPVICTRKDAVKLRHLPLENVWSLRVEASFEQVLWSKHSFSRWFETWWKLQGQPHIDLLGKASDRWTGFSAEHDSLWRPESSRPRPPALKTAEGAEDETAPQDSAQDNCAPENCDPENCDPENCDPKDCTPQEHEPGDTGEIGKTGEQKAVPNAPENARAEALPAHDEEEKQPAGQAELSLLQAFPDQDSPLPPPPSPDCQSSPDKMNTGVMREHKLPLSGEITP